MTTTTEIVTAASNRNLRAFASGNAASGYYAIVSAGNGRRIWESASPYAFADAAHNAAVARASKM